MVASANDRPGTPLSPFLQRHLGPAPADQALMLERLGCNDLE